MAERSNLALSPITTLHLFVLFHHIHYAMIISNRKSLFDSSLPSSYN